MADDRSAPHPQSHQAAIITATACSIREAIAVQGLLYAHLAETRHVYGLDGLRSAEFDRLAREQYEVLQLLMAEDGIADVDEAISRYHLA
jgi:hypothetical protein